MLSLYTAIAWRRPCALRQACTWARACGYAAIDLRGSSLHLPLLTRRGLGAFGWDMVAPELLDEAGVLWVRGLLARCGLGATALSCYAPLTLPPSPERTECMKVLERYIRLAAQLGVPAVRSIGNSPTPSEGVALPLADAFNWNVEGLRSVAPLARLHGIRLLIENNEGTVTESAEDCLRMQSAVGGEALGIVLDCANLFLAGRDPLAGVDAVGRGIDALHVKDVRRLAKGRAAATYTPPGREEPFVWTLVGEGELPWAEVFRRLRAHGFNGPVVYEYANPYKGAAGVWRDLPAPEVAAAQAATALRRWLD